MRNIVRLKIERELVRVKIHDGNAFWNEIGVNAGVSNLIYALTVNPTIYTSCIKQFWATAKVQTDNEEVQIQALVDGKKVIITETSVRQALHLKDAKGTDCLPTATIFVELERMGVKTTAWNEFSSTMASAIILFLDKQVKDMSKHKEIYVTPSYTKKIFTNMKREGKGFSGPISLVADETVIKETQSVATLNESFPQGTDSGSGPRCQDTILGVQKLKLDETIIKEWEDRMEKAATTTTSLEAEQDSGSGPRCQDTILGGAKAQIRFEAASKQSNDPPLSTVNTLGSGEDNMKLKELMEFCTKLSERALDL
ncbi:hypothetical protein Tco_0884504 [Tanacetum coccineum]